MANPRIIYNNVWKKGTITAPSSEHAQHPATDTQIDTKTMFWRTTSLDTPDFIPCDFGAFSSAGIGLLNFDSGSVEPQIGEWLFGAGASGKVVSLTSSGDWGGGAVTGAIVLEQCEGCFNNNEDIRGSIGGTNILTVNQPDNAVGIDKLVQNGAFVATIVDWTLQNGATLTWQANGQIGHCMKVARGAATSGAKSDVTPTLTKDKLYKLVGYIKNIDATNGFIKLTRGAQTVTSEVVTAVSWTKVTKTFRATAATTAYIEFHITGAATEIAHFDEISLYELDEDDTGKKIDFIAILAHNFTGGATIELKGYMESDFSDAAETVVIPYNEDNIFYFFPSAITRRYWTLEITDALNSDDYIEVATILCGKYFELNKTVGLDYEEGHEDFSELEYSDSQVLFSQEKEIIEVRNLPFRGLDDATRANILLFFNECGIHKAFVVCFDPTAANTNSYWVVNTEMVPPRYQQNDCWHWQMAITEIV